MESKVAAVFQEYDMIENLIPVNVILLTVKSSSLNTNEMWKSCLSGSILVGWRLIWAEHWMVGFLVFEACISQLLWSIPSPYYGQSEIVELNIL